MSIGNKLSANFLCNAVLLCMLGVLLTISHGAMMAGTATCLCLAVNGVLFYFVRRSVTGCLSEIASEVAQGADHVFSAAGQISNTSQSLADDTSRSAASLEETSASTEEINSMARRNSQNSHSAASLVNESNSRFADTNRLLSDMVVAMGEINTSSDKISKIIKVIDEIAFQTNILALNAAVEAARAGEAGMGFAVVADEVRSLAQRSAQAARDTAVLIEESISKSNGGKVKVDQVTKAVHSITEQASQIKTLVDEVQLGSEEQSRGIDQIGKAISQMEQVTQKVAASAEQSASAGQQLTAEAASLREIARRLNMLTGGGGSVRQDLSIRPARPVPGLPAGFGSRGSAVAMKVPAKPSVSHSPAPLSVSSSTPEDVFPMNSDFTEF